MDQLLENATSHFNAPAHNKGESMKEFLMILIVVPAVCSSPAATLDKQAYQHQSNAIAGVGQLSETWADSVAPDSSGMRNLSSVELAQEMVPGWNVGNSLDATGGETAWGNPLISQRLIDSVKAAGFRAVRIPVAWSHFSDTAYTIDSAWIARVEQVVNYVLHDSMYAILNEHWDGGWMQPTYAQQAYVNNRLAVMWHQIAVHFRDYGDHLLFAGMNEVMVTNNYSAPTVEYYTVQNGFNQIFVSTVRSTGGRNAFRYLVVQGFNTNIDYTVNYFDIPTDATPNRLMVEVHYYDPYDFTLNANSSITQWGSYATVASKTEPWANESYADGQFQKMETKFIDQGYAVILGEYGAIARFASGDAALNAENARYRLYYMEYITRSLDRHGLVPFYWDNGYTGNNSMGLFDRSTGARAYPDIAKAIVDTVITTNGTTGAIIRTGHQDPEEFSLAQNYPNPFNPSTTISFTIPVTSRVSLKVFDLLGREVATIVSRELLAGYHSEQWNAERISSGIYFYRVQAGSLTETKKLVLVK